MEELFNKSLPVVIKQSDRDEKQARVGITILLHVTTTPVHKKELIVRVTDESDPFFLFNLSLGEADFQGLKVQQGLLVDFTAFPQKFIDLLDLCLSEANQERPKFLLHLWLGGEEQGYSQLEVVETNPFRHLTHLQLRLVPASDTYLKKYLADCLLSLKVENEELNARLISTKSDLAAQLAESQTSLSSRSQELERLRGEWSSHSAQLSSQHAAQLTAEREKNLHSQAELQARHDRNKRELEQSHASKVVGLEARLVELEASQKDLTDHKYRSQAAIRELKSKLKTSEEECARLQEELQSLRRDNVSLDSGLHEREKTLSHLTTRVAVLEQELKDKEQVLGQTSELLRASQERVRGGESSLEQTQRRLSKMEAAFKATSQEVLKGNEIIHKFQNEIRNLKSKLKLRNVATTQQEKLLGEKEASLERQVQENQGLSRSLAQKDEEIQRLEESLQATRGKLEESRELLKTNENVIGWLNKQINEQMMGGRVPPAGPASLPFSTIRHSSSPFTSAPHIPQFSSTPAMGVNSPLMTGGYLLSSGLPTAAGTGMGEGGAGGEDGDRQVLGSLAGKENAKHQVVFRGGAAGKTIGTPAVPSPLSSHSLSAAAHGIGSMTRSPTTSTGVYVHTSLCIYVWRC
ncbi:Spindle assembly abnormal protein 6 homolog [Geodia barretti]|uniref:Spindle assembly abnormal protein 6 homolog n=1 Tax=Geodia barretti TaxID=519541 RepID=A0AA35X1G0_GEOBA|nr:Spindle assembly abnormal protein 6 homolog [Geodia barretti]